MTKTKTFLCFCAMLCLCLSASGCSSSPASDSAKTGDNTTGSSAAARDNTPQVLHPEASGTVTYTSDTAAIDASHTSEGYVMVQYTGSSSQVRLQITLPDSTVYTYEIGTTSEYETFPLVGGTGTYHFDVLECVSGDMYATAFSQDISVDTVDDYKPFLYPNQYVSFDADSDVVAKAKSLAADATSDVDVIGSVYDFVINNITYDTEKAQNVSSGYLPDVDEVLKDKTGICFDYAALMTAMLRSQGIPTKLQIGYSGDAYHAWISTYTTETGWVDNVIEFDGTSWVLMDPTLAASNDAKSVSKYTGDGSNYTLKYTY